MTQELSSSQLRAARALLNWSRAELALRTGVGEQTIHRMENGLNKPEIRTQLKLRNVLEQAGIEFIDCEGVRFRPSDMLVLSGPEGFCRYYDILYGDVATSGGTIDAYGVDEALFCKYLGKQTAPHIARMIALTRSRSDLRMRILIREGDENYVASDYAEYRWLRPQYFSPTCFYVFNQHLALISFSAKPAPQVILIKSKAFAEAYRQQFQKLWETAIIPRRKNAPTLPRKAT